MVRTVNSEILLLVLLLLVPVTAADNTTPVLGENPGDTGTDMPYDIRIFIPTQRMIHADQINDLISGPGGETIIGTSFGLSTYNGSWSTRHRNLNNISEGLMDDYITAVELDSEGNLWIGYSGGIQIYDGHTYRSIRDQQLLKETRIRDLQRWNNDMWVATGHAGIHRYRGGTWTWYQPMTRNGPPFYEVRSMALDVRDQTLVIVTEVEGLWSLQLAGDRPVFKEIAPRAGTWGLFGQARRDPLGGVYLSNATMVVHYDPVEGIVPVLTSRDLSAAGATINDLAVASDGRLFIATDNGMYIWQNSGVTGHLGRYEGMGVSPVLRTIAIDAKNRVWFSSTGYVGFYMERAASAPTIAVEMVEPLPVETLLQETPVPEPTISPVQPVVPQDQAPFFAPDSVLAFLNPIIDPVIRAIRAIGSRG